MCGGLSRLLSLGALLTWVTPLGREACGCGAPCGEAKRTPLFAAASAGVCPQESSSGNRVARSLVEKRRQPKEQGTAVVQHGTHAPRSLLTQHGRGGLGASGGMAGASGKTRRIQILVAFRLYGRGASQATRVLESCMK